MRGRVSLGVGLVAAFAAIALFGTQSAGSAILSLADLGLVGQLTRGSSTDPTSADVASSAPARLPIEQPPIPDASAPTLPLAQVDDLMVFLPTAAPLVVGFHEAATSRGRTMAPIGRLGANRNPTRFEASADDVRGPDYLVLSSRGRTQPATSAADIVMHVDDPVLAPVTGAVVDVRSYWLYGEVLDLRVELAPDEAPDLRVVLVHVDHVLVAAGDRVAAGRTVIAERARLLPFTSQIDRETDPDRWPHVHLEVQAVPSMDEGG